MSETADPRDPSHIPSRDGRALRWLLLFVLSIGLVVVLELAGLSAALLIGPMLAGIIIAVTGPAMRVPTPIFFAAQGLIGCMIGESITHEILVDVLAEWPVFLGAVVSVVAASMVFGWLLAGSRVLPGTTALWGSFPGAASAMTLMAEVYGADVRLVAVMQYLRVVLVMLVASAVIGVFGGQPGQAAAMVWLPPVDWPALAATLAICWGGALAARLLRIPAGPLLAPLVLTVVLQDIGWVDVELPPLLLAAAYAGVGWSIGLRFTRLILRHAARALPRILASIVLLIAVCGLMSVVLARLAGLDPLTAYLAMSPGGADSVAIIAASSTIDLPFVMAMQTARFLIVLLLGPSLARLMARMHARRGGQ
jgi:membrane AbrB-like protein